mgnify:CR=1 FL=1
MATATPTPPSGFVAALVTELRVRRDLGTALITEAPTKLCAAMLAKIARRRLSAFRAKRPSAAAFAQDRKTAVSGTRVDLGGRRFLKKQKTDDTTFVSPLTRNTT